MSMNVYADLGFENPELELAKARVVHVLHRLMEEKRLDNLAATQLLGTTPLEVDEILNGHWDDYTVDRLIQIVHRLNPDVRFNTDTGKVIDEAAIPLALTT